jgi:hypothetical protein
MKASQATLHLAFVTVFLTVCHAPITFAQAGNLETATKQEFFEASLSEKIEHSFTKTV